MLKSYSKTNFSHIYVLVILISLVYLSGVILSSSIASADDSIVDQVTINVPESCTMTGTGMNSHTAEITNGTYTANIGTTTLKAYCNDSNGFSIYAIGYTNDTYGTNTLIGQSTSNTIVTGTATSAGNPDTSNWAMKLTAVSSPTPTYPITLDNGYGSYSIVPSTYTKVAHRDSGTDIGTNAEGSTLTTTYAAYISRTQPADTYEGKVKYTLVHPASEEPLQPQSTPSGYIAYYPNASTALGSMSDANGGPVQQLTNDQTSATLLATNFSRDGYGFAGWSDAYDWATNADAHFYGPNEDISFAAGQYYSPNEGLSLYAVWIPSAGSFQDSAKVAELCGAGQESLTQAPASGVVTLDSVTALTDQRDNQVYAIAKLADGNCWMIENLRLEHEATVGNNINNPSVTNESLAQGYGKYSGTGTNYGNFVGLAEAENERFDNSSTGNSLYSTDGSNNTENIGTSNSPGYRMPRYNHINTDSNPSTGTRAQSLTVSTSYTTLANASIYGYGNYYNRAATIADTAYDGGGIVTSTSICPKGWRLASGGNVSSAVNVPGDPTTWRDYYILGYAVMGNVTNAYHPTYEYAYYNDNITNANGDTATKAFRKFPYNYVYSGYFNMSSVSLRGRYGYYQSSYTYNNLTFYGPQLASSSFFPGTYGHSKITGYSIRCLASM